MQINAQIRNWLTGLAVVLLLFLSVSSVLALDKAAIEKRAVALEHELVAACCWTNVLSEHHSGLAVQMKAKIRYYLKQGKKEAEIRSLFADEYGERVLAKPKAEGFTLVAWVLPPIVLLLVSFFVVGFLRRRVRQPGIRSNDFTDEELAAASQELGDEMGDGVIGLVGRNCAGKGAVAEFLQNHGFKTVSLSDALRSELKDQKLEITRDNLIAGGRKLRRQFGDGVLADRVLEGIDANTRTLVDSIRNPGEVKSLQKLANFKLLAVVADDPLRFERMVKRGRESDPDTYEAFLTLESRESDGSDSSAQQVLQTEKMADATVENNGDVDELHAHLTAVLKQLLPNKN
jgi:cytochrome c-type biogenesis protein CcmH